MHEGFGAGEAEAGIGGEEVGKERVEVTVVVAGF